jgi:hypothetical protein
MTTGENGAEDYQGFGAFVAGILDGYFGGEARPDNAAELAIELIATMAGSLYGIEISGIDTALTIKGFAEKWGKHDD